MVKKFWRCTVCGDVHYGVKPPETCPTCSEMNCYVEADGQEAKGLMFPAGGPAEPKAFAKEEFSRAIADYSKGKAFVLNPDANHVAGVVDGVFTNLEKKGFKFCPCRLTIGDIEQDKHLLCPCNFEAQNAWKEWNRCWCGLYVRKQ